MRILVIDGNSLSASYLRAKLASDGFEVLVCPSCDEGTAYIRAYDYDAIVVGDKATDTAAGAVVRHLRALNVKLPILAVVNNGSAMSRVNALSEGADDCLSVPIDKSELCARLRAIVRRSHAHPHSTIRIGNLELDLNAREVRVSGRPIHFTVTEYRMLELLALRKGITITRDKIFESIYDGRDDPGETVINVFVCRIRKKIAAANDGESYISTTWGGGYQLNEPLHARAA